MTMSKREYGFDVLRVFSMFYIIAFYHIGDYAHEIFTNRVTNVFAYIVLSTFFFISAYLLTNKYKSFSSKKDIINFITKRVFRIYPLYFVALFLFFIVGLISFESFFTGTFLINIFLDIYVRTLWFISLIFIFYILLGFILYHYSFTRLVLIYGIVSIMSFIIHKYYGYISYHLLFYMPSFFIGILYSKYQVLRDISKNKLFLIMLLLIPFIYFYIDIEVLSIDFIFVIVSIPFIFVLSQWTDFNNPFLEYLSYASFTMYIFHRLIYQFLLYIYYPPTDTLVILYLLLIGVPLLFVISFYIQSLYDKLVTKLLIIFL